jgi:predicted nucleotidyltransferase
MGHALPATEWLGPVMQLDPLVIYHFGSSAGEVARVRDDSDIDLAFFAARRCDPYRVFKVAQEIARMAGREVDLVDLGRAGAVIRVQVLGNGRRLFTAVGCEREVDQFELLALADFARLNEERSEVLAAELAR